MNAIARRHRPKSGISIMALEPRLMFDGAAVATAAAAVADHHADPAAHAAPDAAAKAAIPQVAAPTEVRAADPAQDGGKKEVAFVDTSVADYKTLEAGIRDGVGIVEIDGSQSGLAQMAQWAETHSGYDAIHVLSHGSEATVYLGTDIIIDTSLTDNATVKAELAEIGTALKAGGDLLVYGCDVAKGEDGQQFVNDLAGAAGADVAASNDLTGAKALGGNWVLEYRVGTIDGDAALTPAGEAQFRGLLVDTTLAGTTVLTATGAADVFVLDGGSSPNGQNSYNDPPINFMGTSQGSFYDITSFSTADDKISVVFWGQTNSQVTISIGADSSAWNSVYNAWGNGEYMIFVSPGYITAAGFTTSHQTAIPAGAVVTGTSSTGGDIAGTFILLCDPTSDLTTVFLRGVSSTTVTSSNFIIEAAPTPTVTSATYDEQSGILSITGAGMTTGDSIDPTKFTFTGTGGTYTLAGTYSGGTAVTAGSATAVSFTLAAADQSGLAAILDKNGTAGSGSTTYNIAAAANWDSTRSASADLTGNGVTVSGVPTLTSATYDAGTGVLTVTGSSIEAKTGAANDISVGKLTLTGQGGSTYTLTGADVERTSATSFAVTLSATDKAYVNGLLNKDGTSSVDGTTFNLAAADDWDANHTAGNTAVSTVGVTVGNTANALPTITSATYDEGTHVLTVTGSNMVHVNGATNDITVSDLTLKGENGTTRTLTSGNVEIISGTSFSVTLNAADQAAIEPYFNKTGTSSTGGTAYNLAATDDWNSVFGNTSIAVTTAAVTVTAAAPTITSATYNEGTGVLTVTGTGLVVKAGAANDIDPTKLTLTGEGGGSYTLTSSGVEITDSTHFSITLNATDKLAVNGLLNKTGTSAGDSTVYNIAGAAGWDAGEFAASADATGNGVTAGNLQTPAVSGITYDPSTGSLVITGTNFVPKVGSANDVDVTKLTFTGQGSGTRALSTSSNVEITSATSITITLSGADKSAVDALLNQAGTQSSGGTPYNLGLATGWLAALSDSDTATAAATNGVTVTIAPTITSATYDESTGALVVTGTNLQALAGAANDIDATKLTLSGKNGGTYTLTNATGNVEITSATSFTLTLAGADKSAVDALLDKNGTASTDATTYNLAAAANWDAGYTAGGAADLTGNGVTVSNAPAVVSSATYDVTTGVLSVTAANMGVGDTIDASKLTLKGQGGATYTLAGSYTVTSIFSSAFQITLTGADKTNADTLFNTNGTAADDATTYNVAAAASWDSTASAAADPTGNGVTVSGNAGPTITSATYNAGTGVLVVTTDHLAALAGTNNDVGVSHLTLTGEGGATYTLTSSNVERDSLTQFTVTLNATDKAALNQILNKAGGSATDSTTYNLAGAAGWSGAASGATDLTGNAVTVSNITAPAITSATFDENTGTLVITGTNFVKHAGANNDVDATKLTLTGEGTDTYTLTGGSAEITNGTTVTITLNPTDLAVLKTIFNKNGTTSTSGTTYNIGGAAGWMPGDATNSADTTGNGVTTSNVAPPTVTSATYDYATGTLVVTGTNLVHKAGPANDIDLTKLTLTGKNGGTVTLTSTDVEITNGTTFTVTLNANDKAAVNLLLDTNGTVSGGTTYNVAAAGNWARGSATAAADTAGNGVTVSGVPAPQTTTVNNPPSPTVPQPVADTTVKVTPSTTAGDGNAGSDSLHTVVRNDGGGTGFGSSVNLSTVSGTPVGQAVAAAANSSTSTATPGSSAPATGTGTSFSLPSPGSFGTSALGGGGGTGTGSVAAAVASAPAATASAPAIALAPTLSAPAAGGFQVAVVADSAKATAASDIVVAKPIGDVALVGGVVKFSIPADAFAVTRADSTVTLSATRGDGAALPSWMVFNPRTGTFEGTPPPDFRGEVVVKVVARDNQGREAVQTFKIVVGEAGRGNTGPEFRRGGFLAPAGRLSLTEQLRAMGKEGRLAQAAARFGGIKTGGRAA